MSPPSARDHKKKAAGRGPVAIVTVSDTGTPETDVNGNYLCERLQASGNKVHSSQIIRDELAQPERVLNQSAAEDVQVVFFNGGTGISRRDALFNMLNGKMDLEAARVSCLAALITTQPTWSGIVRKRRAPRVRGLPKSRSPRRRGSSLAY